jgi:hypothetical protein
MGPTLNFIIRRSYFVDHRNPSIIMAATAHKSEEELKEFYDPPDVLQRKV